VNDKKFIKINASDDVIIALEFLNSGAILSVDGKALILLDDIPFGHKIALKGIKAEQNVVKYGQIIGAAKCDIKSGQHIHTHNLKTNLSSIEDYSYSPVHYCRQDPQSPYGRHCGLDPQPPYGRHCGLDPQSPSMQIDGESNPAMTAKDSAKFLGFKRKDGSVGIRNEVWIIPTVGCVNNTSKILSQEANREFASYIKEGKIDGFFAYTHSMGCSQIGDDMKLTQKILAGLIKNPNAGAVLVLGLGCENNNVKNFLPALDSFDNDRIKFLTTQEIDDEYKDGLDILKSLADFAAEFKREEIPASELVIGFKCGGSDAFSGITANPLCGKINDTAISLGARTILTETPEMFGAERLLMNRAKDKSVFDDIVNLINNFKNYFLRYKQEVYENPSPGNKEGGITTLEEKSLGCIQKGGTTQVSGVLNYGERPNESGLYLLNGPGNDMVSCTNLTASGAQIILFTTGRGNPFGAPIPTIKISSNTNLYERKKHWIDFNAGEILNGKTFDSAAQDLFEYILNTASGKIKTKNEISNYREIAIFKDGVIL
jgi:altronate hydrolase